MRQFVNLPKITRKVSLTPALEMLVHLKVQTGAKRIPCEVIREARRLTEERDQMQRPAFDADSRTRDAVERCLERVSEAARQLGPLADKFAPGIPWRAVRTFGNVLRHAYDQVDPARIWEIITGDLPLLADAAQAALSRFEGVRDP